MPSRKRRPRQNWQAVTKSTPGLIRNWKQILINGAAELFNGEGDADKEQEELIEQKLVGSNLYP